jgi:hypothetical protein
MAPALTPIGVRAHESDMIDTRAITTCSYFWAYL